VRVTDCVVVASLRSRPRRERVPFETEPDSDVSAAELELEWDHREGITVGDFVGKAVSVCGGGEGEGKAVSVCEGGEGEGKVVSVYGGGDGEGKAVSVYVC